MRLTSACIVVCLCTGACAIAQERTVFSYRDAENRQGCFFHLLAKDWVELTGSGDRFSFKEVGRQDGSIELFDKSRGGVGVRIFADKSEWKSKEGTRGKWASLWSGAWTTEADLRPDFREMGTGARASGRPGNVFGLHHELGAGICLLPVYGKERAV